jgi:hypothetical protein
MARVGTEDAMMGKLIPRGVSEAALAMGAVLAAAGCTSAPRAGDHEDIGAAVAPLSQTCIVVGGGLVADTQIGLIEGLGANQNYGTSEVANSGEVGGGARQALFRFDVSAVPTGWGVVSASVTLNEINHAAATVRVHAITAAWDENTVTWASFDGAYAPAVASTFFNGGPAFNGPVTFDVTTLSQGWVNTPAQNFGVLLEQDPVGNTRYWTTRYPTVSQQPVLNLCYAAPTCSDGIQDQGEQGVDCGGPCPKECPHPPATQMVNAGDTGLSPHFKAVYTLGQPTQNQGKSTSPSYRVQGGLIGANGSLP